MTTIDHNMSHSSSGKVAPVYDSYARLSRVPETGELEKIDNQHADNLKVIDRLGGTLGLALDDGLSAWKKGMRRPDFEKLLERVKTGKSDGCVVWHLDRLFRNPKDLETLIDLAENGYTINSAHGSRDLADPNDRFILRIEVAHATRSSDDTSRRLKWHFEAFRTSGRTTGGPRRFGFSGWDPVERGPNDERVPVSDALVQRERAALAVAAKDIISGVSDATIARRWNAAKLFQASGREWIPATVAATMRRPALGGFVVHNGQIVAGRLPGEPVLDEKLYQRLHALYASRKRGRPVGRKYLGTGILRCVCGIKFSAHTQKPKTYPDGTTRATYYCSKDRRGCGKVYADMRAVDHELMIYTVKRLSDPEFAAAIAAAHAQVSEELKHVEQQIIECRKIDTALAERLGRRQMSYEAWVAATEPLRRDLADLEKERARLRGGAAEGEPIKAESAEVVFQRWERASHEEKRAMLSQALDGSTMMILPYIKTGKKAFDRSRVRAIAPQDPNPGGTGTVHPLPTHDTGTEQQPGAIAA